MYLEQYNKNWLHYIITYRRNLQFLLSTLYGACVKKYDTTIWRKRSFLLFFLSTITYFGRRTLQLEEYCWLEFHDSWEIRVIFSVIYDDASERCQTSRSVAFSCRVEWGNLSRRVKWPTSIFFNLFSTWNIGWHNFKDVHLYVSL